MKRRALLQTSILLPLTLIASNPAFASAKRLRIGVTSGPHADILRAALPVAKKNGLDIKIVEFQDYVSPNEALAAGDLDANIFQTESYLGLMNKQRRYGLVPVGRTITLPLAFYSNRYKSFNQVPQGARVGIPNDPSSEGRALYALQDAGIIKLRPSAGREGSPLDVISNPKKLKFVELDPAQTARSLPDLDVSAVNGNYAFLAGIMGSGKAILYPEFPVEC